MNSIEQETHESRIQWGHIQLIPGMTIENIPIGKFWCNRYLFTRKGNKLTGIGPFGEKLCTTDDCLTILYWIRKSTDYPEYLVPVRRDSPEELEVRVYDNTYPIPYNQRYESGMV
jgi:hypothetical protein